MLKRTSERTDSRTDRRTRDPARAGSRPAVPPRQRIPRLLVSALLLLLLASCSSQETITGPPLSPYQDPTTPELALENLRRAWIARDTAAVRDLYTDDFTFWFSPADRGDPEPTPMVWGRSSELVASDSLFLNPWVTGLSVDFRTITADPEPPEYPGTYKIAVAGIHLGVYTRAADEQPLLYEVPDGRALFYLVKADPTQTGGEFWKVWRWEDEPADPKRTDQMSWGRLKATFERGEGPPP